MNRRIISLNVVFYFLILLFYFLIDTENQNEFLVISVFFFLVLTPLVELFLWRTKFIKVVSTADKIGMFTATPVLPILILFIIPAIIYKPRVLSNNTFRMGNDLYKVVYVHYPKLKFEFSEEHNVTKIEYFKKAVDPKIGKAKWERDSIWIFVSNRGDTLRKEFYRNNRLIEAIESRNGGSLTLDTKYGG